MKAAVDRSLGLAAALILAVAAVASLYSVYEFGQDRFFTVDEYQFGHATWLVSEGERPYLDFYEHHFPLSYVLHAPVLWLDGSFSERILRLRKVPFVYLALLSGVLVAAGYAVTRNRFVALLSAFVPMTLGFGLMSAIDYRADSFSACLFLACLALLEANLGANRRDRGDRGEPGGWNRRSVAVVCGVLFMAAVLMTQKMAFVAGTTLAIWAAFHFWRGMKPHSSGSMLQPPVVFTGFFSAAAAGVLVVALGTGAVLGLLPAAFEATILDAIEHERVYPTSSSLGRYLVPFWSATRISTLALLVCGGVYVASRPGRFWRVPIAAAMAAAMLARTQYPYNYVLVSMLIVLCAVRGWSQLVEGMAQRFAMAGRLRPILYLLPLAVLPAQHDFLTRASSNEQQINLLRKIEAFSDENDVVIDNAGGALFRHHGSYYFHHGKAHRRMFSSYFEGQLIDDYRRSRALFWIADYRLGDLPRQALLFWRRHYIRADLNLYTLGFETPETFDVPVEIEIDVIRAGAYHVHPLVPGAARAELVVDSREIGSGTVHLEEGRHRVTALPHSAPMLVSLLPPEAFEPWVYGTRHYTRLFEFEVPTAR